MPRRSRVRSARSASRITTSPRRYLPVSSSCSTSPRFWSVASSRDAVDLWRPEPAGELGHAGLALALAKREEERRRAIDRPDGVPVEGHRRASSVSAVQPAVGWLMAPVAGLAGRSALARSLEGGMERPSNERHDAVDDVALGVRLAQEPRLARVRLGHRAAGDHADGDGVVEVVVGVRPVAVLGRRPCR